MQKHLGLSRACFRGQMYMLGYLLFFFAHAGEPSPLEQTRDLAASFIKEESLNRDLERAAIQGMLNYVDARLGFGQSTIEVDLAQTIGNVAIVVDDDNISAFKFKAGVNYEATENLDIYGEVWGQAFDDFTIGALEFEDCTMSGVSLGLRYKL